MKLALGTVQFGLDYGISNTGGRTPTDEVRAILKLASLNGIRTLDTAALYGDSEQVLGEVLEPGHPFQVITKTIRIAKDRIEAPDLLSWREGFLQSLKRLRTGAVDGLLAHHADDLLVPGGDRLFEELRAFRQAGQVRKIGVSVYAPEQVEVLLDAYPDIQIVQLPLNVLDQRWERSGLLLDLRARGIEVHARSIFLQGLLCMHPDRLPPGLAGARTALVGLRQLSLERGISTQALLIGYPARLETVTKIVLGVNNRAQLLDNVRAYNESLQLDIDFSSFATEDPILIDPRKW